MITRVFDVMTNQITTFALAPRDAVIAAYALSVGDRDALEYERKYGHMVVEGDRFWFLGQFSAMKEEEA